MVNLSVFVLHRIRASMSGQGDTVETAVRAAAYRAAIDTRFGPQLIPADIASACLELWVQTRCEVIEDLATLEYISIWVSTVGICQRQHSAYYKPSVALTSGVRHPERFLDKLTKKAGLPDGGLCILNGPLPDVLGALR